MFLLVFLPLSSLADCPVYLNFSEDEAIASFEEGVPILEIVFPSIAGCDACILRMGDQTMMIDAGSESMASTGVWSALQAMGIDTIDIAYVSHPHDDHIRGYPVLVNKGITIQRMLWCFPEKANGQSILVKNALHKAGIDIEQVQDGDTWMLGEALVTLSQRSGDDFTVNDRSGVLRITYGDAAFLSPGDIENRAQAAFVLDPPEAGLQADILKHPHHGYAKMDDAFLQLIQPQLVIVTGMRNHITQATKYLEQQNIPWMRPWENPIRMRTDGHIWIVDALPASDSQ